MLKDWSQFPSYVTQMEQRGLVTRTFRRLDLDRQKAVIQAILEEAGERGPQSLNIKNVAQRSGVPVGSLYQYFSNRDAMVSFAVQLCVDYMESIFEESRRYFTEMSLQDSLSSYLSYGVEWSREESWMIKLFARAAYQEDPDLSEGLVRPVATLMRKTVYAILAGARDRGEISSALDLDAAARVVNVLLIAISDPLLMPHLNTYYQVTDDELSAERVFTAALDLLLRGLGASGTLQAGG